MAKLNGPWSNCCQLVVLQILIGYPTPKIPGFTEVPRSQALNGGKWAESGLSREQQAKREEQAKKASKKKKKKEKSKGAKEF